MKVKETIDKIIHPGLINETYPKVAFCSSITPATPEHYDRLRDAGIETVSVCLQGPGYRTGKFGDIHTKLARNAGMVTHAFLVTDLRQIANDSAIFTIRFASLKFSESTKITVWINSDKSVENREEKITKIITLLSRYHPHENIDVAFFKRDIDDKLYDLTKIPQLLNLTIVNCDASSSGVPTAGTWVYTNQFGDTVQTMAYDYYGFYTDKRGYQLSLIDIDYVVQPGDTWYSIARRQGMPLIDLLELNRAMPEDKLFAGQVVRIA